MVLMRVCPWCRRSEPWRRGCRCLPDPAGGPVLREIVGIDLALAVHDYDEVVRRFVLAAKNGGREDLLRRFGVQIAAVLAAQADNLPDSWGERRPTVVWVPASRDRRRRRGYDQGRLLARAVGRELGLPVQPLLRRAGGEAQEGRDRADRLSGPRLRCRVGRAPSHVVVVDDVITTGASVGAAAAALRGSGAVMVVAVAVASSGSNGVNHPPVGNAGSRQVSGLW
ncbi:MAG: hypothetical protein OEW83_13685 [Acidimicrobiia bacterium]|nr:hypothetical protein [Acidimicrobiia bacterium]